MTKSTPILQAKNVIKNFPGVKALDSINFNLKSGQIHALMGENGAGKSTLIKVITGLYIPDAGEIIFEGKPFAPHSPLDASRSGLSTVYQEVNLIPTLTVAENIFIGRQPMKLGRIDWKEMNRRAKESLLKLDIDIDVTVELSSYSVAIQQMVAIARALDISAKVLILDEPTSSLDQDEVAQLFTVMRKLRDDGLGIIFVTHFLDQVYEVTDTITILRNGKLVGEFQTKDLPKMELISKMLGKKLSDIESDLKINEVEKEKKDLDVLLEVKEMKKLGTIAQFDLNIYEGEILSLAGLLGSGRTEIARLVFGIDKPTAGSTFLKGQEVMINSPRKAVDQFFGFCPEDRKTQGIIPEMTVRENIILALQARMGILKYIPLKKQLEIVDKYIKELQIVTTGPEQTINTLSGGNQQKVIIARWLASNPRFLILDEPTRGIDVGAKVEIQKLILDLSKQGISVLFISSELDEVIRCSTRVMILRDRKLVSEVSGDQINEKSIMQMIATGDSK